MKKAVLTVIGQDRVGIIYGIADILAKANINILDISQTIMDDIFTMIMMVDVANSNIEFGKIAGLLDEKGNELSVKITICHEDIFNSMHRI